MKLDWTRLGELADEGGDLIGFGLLLVLVSPVLLLAFSVGIAARVVRWSGAALADRWGR